MHFLIIGPLLHIIDLIHAIGQVVIETLGPLNHTMVHEMSHWGEPL